MLSPVNDYKGAPIHAELVICGLQACESWAGHHLLTQLAYVS